VLRLIATAALAFAPLNVHGNQLRAGGAPIQLRGINRSGTEYACIQGYGITDGPDDTRIDGNGLIRAMTTWKINVVRVPLNEDCWLGINTDSAFAGKRYRTAIKRYVKRLHAHGLYAILDLHVAAPGTQQSTSIAPMADADHAPAFWKSVATAFRTDRGLLFDLYNEPHDISWDCWRNGCDGNAGMQQLVDAVRSTHARQPLLLGGVQYALDASRWVAHAPKDPRHALVISEHNYGGFAECDDACRGVLAAAHKRYPVLIGELGENDCAHAYVDAFMRWADTHNIGYLGWAWDATDGGSWDCAKGPALIEHYDGTPTGLGVGFRDHFRVRAST
jgi:hypothetical protein